MPSDNNQEMFPIVDEQGNITGAATRGECHSGSKLLHPVVHLHVFNAQGDIYLQKRPEWKDIQPGKWDTAVGGHIDLGESVEIAQREKSVKNWASQTSLPSFSPVMFLNPAVKKNLFLSIKPFMMEKFIPATNWMGDDFGRSKK